jgi:hypothetical protein
MPGSRCLRLVVLVARRRLNGLFCCIHRQLAVLLGGMDGGDMDGGEWNGNILGVDPQKTSDRYDERRNRSPIARQYVNDLPDFALGPVIGDLPIVVRHHRCVRRNGSEYVNSSLCISQAAHGLSAVVIAAANTNL